MANTGNGPGEWSPGGTANLHYAGGKLLVSDSNRFLINLYDIDGIFLQEINIPGRLRYSNMQFLSSNEILVAGDGHENSLALILNVNNEGEVVRKIGNTISQTIEHRNLEEIREALSNRKVPDVLKNEALVAANSMGVAVLLNVLGEIHYFDNDGSRKWAKPLPEAITAPI